MESNILAKVNGKEIRQEDVKAFLGRIDPQMAAQYRTPEGEKHILNELINQMLFLEDAKERKLDQTESYKLELAKARDFILTQMNMNLTLNTHKVTEEEARDYYEKEPQQFAKPAKASTSHILVDDKSLCENLRDQIVSGKLTFAEAAKAHSKCPTKDNGGKLGEYAKGKMVPEYDNASFALEVDEISQPVKTQFGYHLIKLHSKTESKEVAYDEVKEEVHKALMQQRQREAYQSKINEMRIKFPVEVLK